MTQENLKKEFEYAKTNIKLDGVPVNGDQENIKKFGRRDVGTFTLVRVPNNSNDPNTIMRGILFSPEKKSKEKYYEKQWQSKMV